MFREMSETELIIQGIKNVRMISIYELTGINDEPGRGCAAISVFYDREGQINLCELDEGFDILADRIFEIYGEAENREQIFMDDRTRSILECGWLKRSDDFLDKFYDADAAELPRVAFEAALSRRFLPLAEYVLASLYRILGIKYEVTSDKTGWRGCGAIYGMKSGTRVISGVKIIQTADDKYEITVNNFAEFGKVLNITAFLFNSCIILDLESEYRSIRGTGRYDLNENGYTEAYEVFSGDKLIFRDKNIKGREEKNEISEDLKSIIPFECTESSAVRLPWGLLYLSRCATEEKNGYSVENFTSCYLFTEIKYSETRCWTRVTNFANKLSLKTLSVIMLSMILADGSIQTYFVPHIGNHKRRYRKKLEGRVYIKDWSKDEHIRKQK